MRRLFVTALAVAAVLAFSAGPAAAKNTGTEGGGPPIISGFGSDNSAAVFHCKAIDVPGAVAINKNGEHGNCDFDL